MLPETTSRPSKDDHVGSHGKAQTARSLLSMIKSVKNPSPPAKSSESDTKKARVAVENVQSNYGTQTRVECNAKNEISDPMYVHFYFFKYFKYIYIFIFLK